MTQWDERYAADEFYYGTEPNDFLRDQAGRIRSGGRVLCIAEGEGRNAVYLAGLGYAVTAMDQSQVGLARARSLANRRGVSIDVAVGDLSAWDFAPRGVLILEAYTPRQLEFGTGGPPTAELMPTLAELRQHLSGLEFVIAEEREREVREGRGHHGHSAVVQIVAQRPPVAVTTRPR